jgi:hypothetical protein
VEKCSRACDAIETIFFSFQIFLFPSLINYVKKKIEKNTKFIYISHIFLSSTEFNFSPPVRSEEKEDNIISTPKFVFTTIRGRKISVFSSLLFPRIHFPFSWHWQHVEKGENERNFHDRTFDRVNASLSSSFLRNRWSSLFDSLGNFLDKWREIFPYIETDDCRSGNLSPFFQFSW